ncbi:RICIN domain-containing protein [Streptomyces goshikiensis]|uniref:RICIN domain-containing protein n=1 Tax=Streptomyces goshikiensis TaxID=1942 RepID=UPI00364BB876
MNGAKVIQWPCSNSNNENWRPIHNTGPNNFKLQAEHSGKCLNVNGASHNNLAGIIQWDCTDTNNNRWISQTWNP